MGQAKRETPRWRRKPAPAAPTITVKGRGARQIARDLRTTIPAAQPVTSPPAGLLARTGAYRFRRHLIPVWLLLAMAGGLGCHAAGSAKAAGIGITLGILGGAGLWLLTRHLKGFTRKAGAAMAALTALWVPCLTLAGPVRPLLVLAFASWLCLMWAWARHYRWRSDTPEPVPHLDDIAVWRERIAAKRLKGTYLAEPGTISGGRTWTVMLPHGDLVPADVLANEARIAGAWDKPRTEVFVEPYPDGRESRAKLTILRRDSLSDIAEWDGQGIDLADGTAVIAKYADGMPARIRFYARRDGIRHGLIAGTTGAGKALALDTPVPTPAGWTTMGEIKAGDVVYDERGLPCRVAAAWPVRHGRPCYEVEFSDGSAIVADAEHLWLADTRLSRVSESNAARKGVGNRHPNRRLATSDPVVITTEQMRAGLTATASGNEYRNYSIRVAAPLSGEVADLEVPPYTLGAWLGDGTSATGSITSADPELAAEMAAEVEEAWGLHDDGDTPLDEVRAWPATVLLPKAAAALRMSKGQAYGWLKVGKLPLDVVAGARPMQVTTASVLDILTARRRVWAVASQEQPGCSQYRVKGLTVRLRSIGVLGNKHIPVQYLRASLDQRRALLAGLLDTDGYCRPSGSVEFSNTNERLARDVLHLVSTLGYKASLRSKIARIEGRDCGIAWTVAFTPCEKVFRLQRKLCRQVTTVRKTAGHRYVTDIRPVPSVPVRCITVDSPSHLYLVGDACIPTHNTYLLDLIIRIALTSGFIVPVVLDPQEGQSLPQWRKRVPYASGVDECMAMLRGLQAGMLDRSRYLSSLTWQDEDGFEHEGADFYDHEVAKRPMVLIIGDEYPVLLTDPKHGNEAIRLTADIGKRGRKTGVSLWPVAQVPSLSELGDQVVRSMLAGGNVICLRTGDRVSASMLGLDADPSSLPRYFADGSPTYGLGYVLGPDNRQATARTLLPSRAVRRQVPVVPELDLAFAGALELSWRHYGRQDSLPVVPAAPAVTLVADAGADKPGRTAADAVLAVLDREMTKGEVIEAATLLVAGEWKRQKPFAFRSWNLALSSLSEDGRIAHPERGTYAPVHASLHVVPQDGHATAGAGAR